MKKKIDILCHIKECPANYNDICETPSAIIIEETGICQIGLYYIEKIEFEKKKNMGNNNYLKNKKF